MSSPRIREDPAPEFLLPLALVLSQDWEAAARIRFTLQNDGYDVFVATSPTEAFAVLELHSVEFVFIHFELIAGGPAEFLGRARSIDPGARLILLAERSHEAAVVDAIEAHLIVGALPMRPSRGMLHATLEGLAVTGGAEQPAGMNAALVPHS